MVLFEQNVISIEACASGWPRATVESRKRIVINTIRTCFECCLKKPILLKAGINNRNDKIDIHPQNICNACNTNISQQATSITTIGAFQWVEHSQDNCSVCEHFRRYAEGERPTTVTRSRLTINPTAVTLQVTVQPSWGRL